MTETPTQTKKGQPLKIGRSWDELNIQIPRNGGKEVKTQCPECSDKRSTAQKAKEKCVQVNPLKGIGVCYHCETVFLIENQDNTTFQKAKKEERKYKKPVPSGYELNPNIRDWFESERKISQATLIKFGVTATDKVHFNYYRNNELVNIKHRTQEKKMWLEADCELIFYNFNAIYKAIERNLPLIITEGEPDALTVYEADPNYCVVSVPNGAGGKNLSFIDSCSELLDRIDTFIIATDGDSAGEKLAKELTRRLGVEKCKYIQYPTDNQYKKNPLFDESQMPAFIKDLNEVLIWYGANEVKSVIDNALHYPLEGVNTVIDEYNSVFDLFENGLPDRAKTGIYPELDKKVSFAPPQLITITGSPGSGKSDNVDSIALGLAKNEGWKFGVLSFENSINFHIAKLAQKYVGKRIGTLLTENDRTDLPIMSREELDHALNFLYQHFVFLKSEIQEKQDDDGKMIREGVTLEKILSYGKQMVRRFGINGLIIDPYNRIQHEHNGMSETNYIGYFLSELIFFAQKYNVAVFLVAHPTKLPTNIEGKTQPANLYSISGSANFYNMTDIGITFHRENKSLSDVEVNVEKVRFDFMGKTGKSVLLREHAGLRFYESSNPEGDGDVFNLMAGEFEPVAYKDEAPENEFGDMNYI